MNIPDFKIEKFFEKYEFSAPYMLGASDSETLTVPELLAYADAQSQELWNNLKLSYTNPHGSPLLREEIAKLHTTMDSTNILVCSGAQEAIYATVDVILEPGDHVVVITPCWQSLKTLPQFFGAEVSEVALTATPEWHLDMTAFKNAVRDNTRLIIVNFPHNPTSYLPTAELFAEIIAVAKSVGAYLLSDEVYRFSEHDSRRRLPAAADCYDKAISIGVMSKSFGFPGLRIGWVATHESKLLEKIMSHKLYLTICNSGPSEILSVIALRSKEKILQRNQQIVDKNLSLLDEFFKDYPQLFTWKRPIAGVTAFTQLKHPMPIDEFVEKLIESQGVVILPGSVYDYPGNYFRIGFGRTNMPEALMRLNRFIEAFF